MAFVVTKASRTKGKLRIGLFGVAGAGKTLSSLRLAYGLHPNWDEIGYVDTEHGSAALYAGMTKAGFTVGSFKHGNLEPPYSPEAYIDAIKQLEQLGCKVIVVDSISHEWNGKGGLLEIVDTIGATKYRGNGMAAWKDATPRHQRFIDAMLMSSAHVIACGRSKMEYAQGENASGKKTVEKLGMAPVTRDGFDYEMTVGFDIAQNHHAVSTKDRTGLFDGKDPMVLTEKHGQQILDWYESGTAEAEVIGTFTTPPPEQPATIYDGGQPMGNPDSYYDELAGNSAPPPQQVVQPALLPALPPDLTTEEGFKAAFINACNEHTQSNGGAPVLHPVNPKKVMKHWGVARLGEIPAEAREDHIASITTMYADPDTGDIVPY